MPVTKAESPARELMCQDGWKLHRTGRLIVIEIGEGRFGKSKLISKRRGGAGSFHSLPDPVMKFRLFSHCYGGLGLTPLGETKNVQLQLRSPEIAPAYARRDGAL